MGFREISSWTHHEIAAEIRRGPAAMKVSSEFMDTPWQLHGHMRLPVPENSVEVRHG